MEFTYDLFHFNETSILLKIPLAYIIFIGK